MIEDIDREMAAVIRLALHRSQPNMPKYDAGIIEPYLARHRELSATATRTLAADMLQKVIENGYPTPARKVDQCAHGKFGWEDCIACYDNQLFNLVDRLCSAQANGDSND